MKISDILNIEYSDFVKLSVEEKTNVLRQAQTYTKNRIARYEKAKEKYEYETGKKWTNPSAVKFRKVGEKTIITNYQTNKPIPLNKSELSTDPYESWRQLKELKNYLSMKRSTVKGSKEVLKTAKANIEKYTDEKINNDDVNAILEIAEYEMDDWEFLRNYERWRVASKAVKENRGKKLTRKQLNEYAQEYRDKVLGEDYEELQSEEWNPFKPQGEYEPYKPKK